MWRRTRNVSRVLNKVPASQVKKIVKSFESEGASKVIAEKDLEGYYKIKAFFEEEVLEQKLFHAN